MASEAWERLTRSAGRTLGVFTTAEAESVGVTRNGIRSRTLAGEVARVHRGVYRFVAAADGPMQRLLATIRAAGDGAAAAHLTAAAVWTLGDLEVREPFHLLTRERRNRQIEGAVLHRSSVLSRLDVTTRGLIPVTTPWRTTIDTCGMLDPESAEDLVIEALRRGMATGRQLRDVVARLRNATGTAVVRRVLETFDPEELARLLSWLEATFLRGLRREGLPLPHVNRHVHGPDGALIGKVDFVWEWAKLVVEVDGLRWHSLPSQKRYDDDRQNELVLAGYRVLRFGAGKIRDELPEVLAAVARALASA
ncbi:MAG: type IV toxin-antitoxin system AbiEi family antitoxin domain-containing protein [Nitriliruptorales bacterium]